MPNASLTIDGTEVIKKENGVVSLKNTNADTSLSFPANHAGIKTALNASGDAPIYACRAWVNFDGTTNEAGFCTIRDSGNVSSITDNGTDNGLAGIYTVTFATEMQDANYSAIGMTLDLYYGGVTFLHGDVAFYTTSSLRIIARNNSGTEPALGDPGIVCLAVFR